MGAATSMSDAELRTEQAAHEGTEEGINIADILLPNWL